MKTFLISAIVLLFVFNILVSVFLYRRNDINLFQKIAQIVIV